LRDRLKACLVIDLIRGGMQGPAILRFTNKRATKPIEKVLLFAGNEGEKCNRRHTSLLWITRWLIPPTGFAAGFGRPQWAGLSPAAPRHHYVKGGH
jgi:hypothetical protein